MKCLKTLLNLTKKGMEEQGEINKTISLNNQQASLSVDFCKAQSPSRRAPALQQIPASLPASPETSLSVLFVGVIQNTTIQGSRLQGVHCTDSLEDSVYFG